MNTEKPNLSEQASQIRPKTLEVEIQTDLIPELVKKKETEGLKKMSTMGQG
jgi:hypothetical protein